MLTLSWKGCPISELSLALRHKTDEAGYQQPVWGGQLITFRFTTGSFQNSTIKLDTCTSYNCFIKIHLLFSSIYLEWGSGDKKSTILFYTMPLCTPPGAKSRIDAQTSL